MYQTQKENFYGKRNCGNTRFEINPNELFGDKCEEAKQTARNMGYKSTKDWLNQAEKKGVISTSERISYTKLIETRNLKDHGGSQYITVTSKAIHDIKTVIHKMNSSVNSQTYKKHSSTAFTQQQNYSTNMTRTITRKSQINGKIYYFNLSIVRTRNYGFVINIDGAPEWNAVKRNFRDFQIVSSEKGCHIYSPAVLSTLEEADRLISVWVNRYVQKLDNLKRYQN